MVGLRPSANRPRRPRPRYRKTLVRGLLVLCALAGILLGLVGWRASKIVELLFHNWAVTTVTQRSHGAYRLDLGPVRLNWLFRRVTVDSIRLTTNPGVNSRRVQPLAEVNLTLDRCTLSGVHLVALVVGRGLVADSFACRTGSVEITGPHHGAAARTRFLVLGASPPPPARVPRVSIAQVTLTDLAFGLRLPDPAGGETRFALAQVQWHMADFALDPTDSTAASRPLFSRTVELSADSFVTHPDSGTAAHIAHVRASLTDSIFDATGLDVAPTAAAMKLHPHPGEIVRASGARARMEGVDFGAFALGLGVHARRLTVDSLRVENISDKRQTGGPARHATPQAWIAKIAMTVDIDSLVVREGTVVYREQRPDQTHLGVLTFTHIDATAAPVRHIEGRRSSQDSMAFVATALVQEAGRIDVRFTAPLDAATFDMAFSGTLGPMPAIALNGFLENVYPWKVAHGQVQAVTFNATVHRGIARGAVTPLYSDLSFTVTGMGSHGLLGSRGIVGGAVRGLASLAANWTQVNGDNPGNPAKPPRTGLIRHSFTSDQSLVAFLWGSVRDALFAVVRK